MTVRTRAELNSDADTYLPDNTSGDITPADVRQRLKDLSDSALLAEDVGSAALLDTGTGSGNVPVLDGSGKLDTSVLPAVAITDTFIVSSQVAMLALTAEKGDIAVRTDLNKCFVLATNSPSTLADWKELLTPTDAVLSVVGLTGAISQAALKTALAIAQGDVSGLTTADSPQLAGINLGHASDTTLTRGAAGFVAVEGKRVPSPASQAQGDILYRGSTEWERLAKGADGQVLTLNSGLPAWDDPAGGGSDFQEYDTPGSFTWNKPSSGSMVLIECWGAGASGGRSNNNSIGGGGGGGGAYVRKLMRLADLASTVAVIVGAGGASRTSGATAGEAGGNSSFGSHLVGYGGGAGGTGTGGSNAGGGGGGGGQGSAGANSVTVNVGGTGGNDQIGQQIDPINKGGTGGNGATSAPTAGAAGASTINGGGGGGGGAQGSNLGYGGGASGKGGGGGGGGGTSTVNAGTGGGSVEGGDGGAGNKAATAATAGAQPGGGGGGSCTGNSGAGGDGRVRVTVW